MDPGYVDFGRLHRIHRCGAFDEECDMHEQLVFKGFNRTLVCGNIFFSPLSRTGCG
jgi:hypothetical protein